MSRSVTAEAGRSVTGFPVQKPRPPSSVRDQAVFRTRWFDLVERTVLGAEDPFYFVATLDYVSVVAVTADGQFLLVRQFRPAIGRETLELPSGHVEPGQTPVEAARQELLEETGYDAERFVELGVLSPCTGRLGNRLWCYFADGAKPTHSPSAPEQGIRLELVGGSLSAVLEHPEFVSALHHAALLLAVAKGFVQLEVETQDSR